MQEYVYMFTILAEDESASANVKQRFETVNQVFGICLSTDQHSAANDPAQNIVRNPLKQ